MCRYGNRGHNQPCIHPNTMRCFITTQNHGFAVDANNLPSDWSILFTNANDQSNEGIIHDSKPYFSVQFHPEHMGGPRDLEGLFDVFINACKAVKGTEGGTQAQHSLSKEIETFLTTTAASNSPIPRPSIYNKGYDNIKASLKKVQCTCIHVHMFHVSC